jgi:hypothetical protein
MAGGNGKVQMDELAKGIILAVFIFSAVLEGFRKHDYHVFSDAYYFALLGAVCLIAGIKHGSKLFSHKDKPKETDTP